MDSLEDCKATLRCLSHQPPLHVSATDAHRSLNWKRTLESSNDFARLCRVQSQTSNCKVNAQVYRALLPATSRYHPDSLT